MGNTIFTIKTKLETFKNTNKIPVNFVAFEEEKLVGTFNIMPFDPPNRKDLSPWFASNKLYLCTPNRQQMYAKLGWKPIDQVEFRDETVTIMEVNT